MTEERSFETLRKLADPADLDAYGVSAEATRAFSIAMGDYVLRDIHGMWLEPESQDGHCDPEKLVVTLGERSSALCQLFNGTLMQSPIEEQLAAALLWLDVNWAGFPSADGVGAFGRFKDDAPYGNGVSSWLTMQAPVVGYKVDILLWFSFKKFRRGIAIECDGHAFHEKTKEQVARGKKRDRDLLAAGFPPMHFSGSEIYRDVVSCASQVRDVADGVLDQISIEGGLFNA